ncbi:hypothetical protein HKD37_15G043656 [Glycine soja]
MSPSPLGSHNHSQTHLKLSEWLPLRTRVSTELHTAKFLRTLWNLDLSLSRTPKHAKASSQGQILVHAKASSRKMPNSLCKYDFRLK